MSRIGNRTQLGRFTLSAFRELEATEAQSFLEQQVASTHRLTVVRCVYRSGADFPEHFHPQEQITIVEEGALEFLVDGEWLTVRKGEMIALEPDVRHSTRVPSGNGGAVALNLFLKRSAAPGGTPSRFHIPTVVRPLR